MTNPNSAAQAANENPLSDEYVNAIIQRHGYDSPECVIARLHQWIGLHGGENGLTLLMYEAHKTLSELRAPVADERAAFVAWLTGSYPDAYSEPEAVRLWHHEHISALAWEERGRRAALASAPVTAEAQPAAYLTLDEEGSPCMLFFDVAEARGYCALGEEPEPLYRCRAPAAGDAQISAYALPDGTRVERAAQSDGAYLWAVRRNGDCLGRDRHWSYEPLPSSRSQEWLALHRFPTAQAAIDAAIAAQRKGGA